MSAAQRTVLYALRRRGEATTDDLSAALGITESGTRQHIAALTVDGLVETTHEQRSAGQRGRTRLLHRLTPAAESLFPKAYGELTNELLGYLGDEVVVDVFSRRRNARIDAAKARVAPLPTFAERVAEMARILDEDGYLADFTALDDGSFHLTEHNCAILAVAQHHPQACVSEIEFLRTVLSDATVERVSHMIAGAHSCSYLVAPR